MSDNSSRMSTPRFWAGLTLATAAVGVGLSGAAGADGYKLHMPKQAGVWLAAAEGGEGGEAGAVANVAPDAAYLVRLAIVEGHLIAAKALYENGLQDEAIGLSYHPEAEMMDEVRESLALHEIADFTPLMQAFSTSMEQGGDAASVTAALAEFQIAVAAAFEAGNPSAKTRFSVVTALAKASAAEYEGSIEDGKVTDVMAYHEAMAFLQIARNLAGGLANVPELAKTAARVDAVLADGATAFGATADGFAVHDPAILFALAAKVELISSQVR